MYMKIRKLALISASLAILAAIIWLLNPARLLQTLSGANPGLVAAAFLVSNCALFFRVMKWKALLRGVSFRELAPIQFFGISVSNLTPGKIGEPVKSMALKMEKGIPVSSSLFSVIWERIMDVIVMMIFGITGFYFIAPGAYMPAIVTALAIFSALIILLLAVMYREKFGRKAFAFLRRFPVVNRIGDGFISNFYSGASIPKVSLASCFFWTFLAWLSDGIVFYLVFISLVPSVPGLSMPLVFTCVLSISVLVGLLSSLPGGVGGTEAAMILILGAIGMPAEIAGSTVLLGRAFTFGYSLIPGYLSFLYLGKKIDIGELLKGVA